MLTLALTEILNSRNAWIFVPFGAFLIPISAIVLEGLRGIAKAASLEKSRREIAAYVAEGSMTTEEAERLLNAGHSRKSGKDKC